MIAVSAQMARAAVSGAVALGLLFAGAACGGPSAPALPQAVPGGGGALAGTAGSTMLPPALGPREIEHPGTLDLHSIAETTDGHTLATGSGDSAIRLRDPATGQVRLTIQVAPAESRDWITGLAFSPDGRDLASVQLSGHIQVWDPASGARRLADSPLAQTDTSQAVAWSPDGHTLASAGEDGAVHLWDAATGRLAHTLVATAGRLESVRFAPDGATIAAGSTAGPVIVWTVASGAVLQILRGHTEGVRALAWAPDGTSLASGSDDMTTRLWNAGTSHVQAILPDPHDNQVTSLAWTADSRFLVTASHDANGAITLWSVRDGAAVEELHPDGPVNGFVLLPGDRMVGLATEDQPHPLKLIPVEASLPLRAAAVAAIAATAHLQRFHFAVQGQHTVALDDWLAGDEAEGDYIAPDHWYARGLHSGQTGEFLKVGRRSYKRDAPGGWIPWEEPDSVPPRLTAQELLVPVFADLAVIVASVTSLQDVGSETLAGRSTRHFAGAVDADLLAGHDPADGGGLRTPGHLDLWIDSQTGTLAKLEFHLLEARYDPFSAATPTPDPADAQTLIWTFSRPNDATLGVPAAPTPLPVPGDSGTVVP